MPQDRCSWGNSLITSFRKFSTHEGNNQSKAERKGGTTMKTTITIKTTYIGAGAGLVLFALFGLLPGSLLGGAMGINIAGWFFGLPLEPRLVSRIIVLTSMLFGVWVAGVVMVTASSAIGWLVGKVLEAGTHTNGAEEAKAGQI
jgi:hypothetical protein